MQLFDCSSCVDDRLFTLTGCSSDHLQAASFKIEMAWLNVSYECVSQYGVTVCGGGELNLKRTACAQASAYRATVQPTSRVFICGLARASARRVLSVQPSSTER